MSTCLESAQSLPTDLLPRKWAWTMAALAPVVLLAPWLFSCRAVGAPSEIATMRCLLLVLLIVAATTTDLLRRRIYNWTSYTIFGWVLLLEFVATIYGGAESSTEIVATLGMLPWRESLAGFAAGFGIMFVLYNVFRGGAGDLKLVAVLGALVGVQRIVEILIYAYILAGVFAACLVVAVVGPLAILAFAARSVGLNNRVASSSGDFAAFFKRQVPMAPFITGGTLIALLLS
jgi:prepilin peptidase CpaA